MSEHTNITNLLLLSVLAGILLISGSLQCAFDCLTQADSLQAPSPPYSLADRVDTCHPSIDNAPPTINCVNKACHQRLPRHRNLGNPEIYRLDTLPQPLYSGSRQPNPQYRAGSAIKLSSHKLQPELRLQTTSPNNIPQTLINIRTTVILC